MSSRRQYFINIIWSWISAVALIINGMLVTPFLIGRLGTEKYGIWTVGLSFVEYFWLIDLGLRPTTVKLTAQYAALEDWKFLNSILSSAVSYSSLMGVSLMLLISLNADRVAHFLRIQDPAFTLLIHVVSISWACGLVFNIFEAALEGFQRFDITGRVFICSAIVRSSALVAVAALGYGLRGMSITLLCTQLLMYSAFAIALLRIYPKLRLSPALASKKAGKEIFDYARQIVSSVLSARLIGSAVPSLISRFLSPSSVTYYTATQKVLDYAGDGIGRIGVITTPRAADITARGQRAQLVRLSEYGNRYCLMLWLLVATWLSVYGTALFRIWIKPEFADHVVWILPCMIFGYTFWVGQFVSASVLMGTGEYNEYSISLMIEAILLTGGFVFILPRFGLNGAAAWMGFLIFSNRFVNLARIFAKKFHINVFGFVWRSFRGPLSIGLLDILLLWIVRSHWLPGKSWKELIITGAANTILLGLAALWLVAEPEHRQSAFEAVQKKRQSILGRELIAAQPPVSVNSPGGAPEA